jgi:hypothetical protein
MENGSTTDQQINKIAEGRESLMGSLSRRKPWKAANPGAMGSKKKRNRPPDDRHPNFQPITALPLIASLIDGHVQDAQELLASLERARAEPHLLDDATLDRLLTLHGKILNDAWIFDEQLQRWQQERLSEPQRQEVERLQQQLVRHREGSQRLLDLAHELKKGSIDAILRMSDEERGQAVLSGRLPSAQRKSPKAVACTAEQLHIASLIDARVRELTRAGLPDDVTFFASMADFIHHLRENDRARCRQRPPRPPKM